jgi:hypothetical protein
MCSGLLATKEVSWQEHSESSALLVHALGLLVIASAQALHLLVMLLATTARYVSAKRKSRYTIQMPSPATEP